jgi:hypothetical protein
MSYSDEVLADTPLIYWRLNEASGNFADSSGNGWTATVKAGAPTYSQPPAEAGIGGTSISLPGATYAQSANTFDFPDPDVFTIEAWINTSIVANTGNIFESGSGGCSIRVDGSTGLVQIIKSHLALIGASTVAVNDGSWHYVVWTKDGATNVIYVDAAVATGAITNATCVSSGEAKGFGVDYGEDNSPEANTYFIGGLDEIAIYGTALSSTRVSDHFAAATATAPANTVAPVASGSPVVGQTLSVTDGTWTGTAPITFTYQWQRDNNGGGVYGDIGGATNNTYLLVNADLACNVRCVVTGTNTVSAVPANSNSLGPVTAPTPSAGGQRLSRLVLGQEPQTIVLRGR